MYGCGKPADAGLAAGGAPPPAGVNAAKVVPKQVTEWDEFIGRVEAKETVEIRPRVGGYLRAVHFNEGGEVKKGDLLFMIDDREFQAALATAQSNVVRAKSDLDDRLVQAQTARATALMALCQGIFGLAKSDTANPLPSAKP